MNTFDKFYKSAKLKQYQIEDATIAIRTFGEGKALVLIHGFVVHGYTWRKMLPELAKHFKCYVLDLPGFGDSQWTKKTDFTFTAQARRLDLLFKKLQLKDYHILAHDTGASIARMLAILQVQQVEKMVLINTEIPNHRPPFIPMHQVLAKLPGANLIFRSFLKIGFVVRSPLLLKQFFYDTSLLKKAENLAAYLIPLKTSSHKMFGMLEYLKGIEWDVVDSFQKSHQAIQAETLFIWGEEDKTFPIQLAKKMTSQFSVKCELKAIPKTALMPHEEQPVEVLDRVLLFLR